MPENIVSIVITSLFLGIGMLAMVRITVRAFRNKYAPVKTVKATVIDKQKLETFSKYAGNGKREKYVVVFSVDGRKKSFYVSEFSYGGYQINEKGTLKYQGDRLIEFK